MIPGWPYSVVAALQPGRTSWTAVLDAVRLGPAGDETDVTAAQVREVVTRLIEAGQQKEGDPDILVVFDAGYDVTRLAFLLTDLPVELAGLRSDRVLYFPAPPRAPGANGRPSRHGPELKLAEPGTWPDPPVTTVTQTTRYGTAVAQSWDRLHPRLTSRAAWQEHDGALPVIDGPLSRPGVRDSGLMRWSAPGARGNWLMYGDFGVRAVRRTLFGRRCPGRVPHSVVGAPPLATRMGTPCLVAVCLDQLDKYGRVESECPGTRVLQAEFAK